MHWRDLRLRVRALLAPRRIERELDEELAFHIESETQALALASAACGLAISRVVLEATIDVVMTTMPPEIAENVRLSTPAADWRVLVFLVAGAIVSTVFFGLAPALQATRLELSARCAAK